MALSDVLGVLAGSFGAGLSEYGAEQQRRQELARKKAEEERIKQATEALFRGGDVTPELAGAAITAGVSPTVVGSAQMFGRRQETPPNYMEGVNQQGYKYRYNPETGQTITSPVREYRSPSSEQTVRSTLPNDTQSGVGLAWLLSGTPQERARKQNLLSQFEAANPSLRGKRGQIGYMLMQAERGTRGNDNEEW